MATIVLSSVGAAVGGSIGGSFAGLSTAVIGRAVGATLGRVIDQSLLGQGSDAVETGRVDRFRLSSVGEGEPLAQIYGRTRIGGQVIWASDFLETVSVTGGGGGGGKGGAPSASQSETRSYSYSVNLAVAICEGEVIRLGRVWADGEEIARNDLNLRLYTGREDQLPDPLIEAIEGAGAVPAYRGTAYVVIEGLELAPFGNRVPQFSFEVSRPEQSDDPDAEFSPTFATRSVALIPGTGEYSLATTPVYYANGAGRGWSANINTPAMRPDFSVSLDMLNDELPNCEAASLVVSWFGDDLRCGTCRVRPMVEKRAFDGGNMPWTVSGLSRPVAQEVPQDGGQPVYGGTPTDRSVIEAIQAIHATGKSVLFYPFILMDQMTGNARPDPYGEGVEQPVLPWRGRITLSVAPGLDGSPDGTAVAASEVDQFFGNAQAADFAVSDGFVTYSGPDEWSFSRFILHYAALCQASGGVEAFCIGSELRGLTQIRGPVSTFVAVSRLRTLAAEARQLLGPATKISYAADWSEYFGYQPQDGSGDRFFHLDPLWADPNIDFIGIDNYMPLSDWRDGPEHRDASFGTVYDLDYLRSNIEGGEGFDWYYASPEGRIVQDRLPIKDGAHGEPWVYRYKDLRGWWENPHHDRVAGVRAADPTAWVPRSKPFWFTELGCAAIDKGTNQPNKFVDPKSSESSLPHFSNGGRDDLIQTQYLRAIVSHWSDPARNPVSPLYDAPMIDMSRAFVWAWDARPYPYFPNNTGLWSDAANYARGHWLNGRTSARLLSSVVAEICRRAGVTNFDTSKLYGLVRGYVVSDITDARAALQPLMLRHGFDAIERDGVLSFRMREGRVAQDIDREALALSSELDCAVEQTRASVADLSGRVRLRFVQADADFDVLAEEAVLAEDKAHAVSTSEMPLVMTRGEGQLTVERWLAETRVGREKIRFALPPSRLSLGAGDIVALPADQGEAKSFYRIDRVEQGLMQLVEAVRIENDVYQSADMSVETGYSRRFAAPRPVYPLLLDLPLITGDETPHAPHIAVTADPWPGPVSVFRTFSDSDYRLLNLVSARATVGVTGTALAAAPAGRFDYGLPLEVTLTSGTLSSVDPVALLRGANLAAIGTGAPDNWEVFQFASAELIGERTYRLSCRLRGQFGTDAIMPDAWPEGADFVLLDGVPEQLDLSRNLRGIEQTLRIGPASRPLDDPAYAEQKVVFPGVGLRPYAPVHLRAVRLDDGDVNLTWIRRTRLDGDSWDTLDVPLGEDIELYLVRIRQGGTVLREDTCTVQKWQYSVASQVSDGVAGPFEIEVRQVSSTFGPGAAGHLMVTG